MAKNRIPSLKQLLRQGSAVDDARHLDKAAVRQLQLAMLRTQQAIWHSKKRVIILLEGFDAAGKGGAIRRLTKNLDPRSFQVYPIGPPNADEQDRHYMYRFWKKIPLPGMITILDRSWYGRVLVERVDSLIPEQRWRDAYVEINEFEASIQRDGIELIKIFLAISRDEQLQRFKSRLQDPYKRWKLTHADISAHKQWDRYVEAVDEMFAETSTKDAPWWLVPGDAKIPARGRVLEIVTEALEHHRHWLESTAQQERTAELSEAMRLLENSVMAK